MPISPTVKTRAKAKKKRKNLNYLHTCKIFRNFAGKLGNCVNMKKKIAIIAGGDSSEYGVSLRSAAGIYSFLDKEKYDVTVVCLRGSDWKAEVEENVWVDIDKNDFSFSYNGKKTNFDFAYITIHGTPGENGVLQGYLDMIGLPYSCCGVLAAAMTFNKYTCNHYLKGFGVRVAESVLLRKAEGEKLEVRSEDIIAQVGLPCFIKTNVGGSSFGVTKVKTVEEVEPAIQKAFAEGSEVICEAFMKGVEITCGVYKTRNKAVAFPITEVVTSNEFFDYDAKYNGQVDEITPARIPDEVRDAVQALTLKIYDILGCKGIIRVDYILTSSEAKGEEAKGMEINLLEVNTTPGMTATSFIPQQVKAAGLDIKDVLSDIIDNELEMKG
jgi:D-alanine-D-alanine ligase